MQISFGARMPISTCNVLNTKTKQYERATMYEIDCKDTYDCDYVESAKGKWNFKNRISELIRRKYNHIHNINKYDEGYGRDAQISNYYSLENENGEIIGLCETRDFGDHLDVYHIESSPEKRMLGLLGKKYRYIGQAMLANMAKIALRSDEDLTAEFPASSAYKFYSEVCRFKKSGNILIKPKEDIPDFISNVEWETQGKILDYKG